MLPIITFIIGLVIGFITMVVSAVSSKKTMLLPIGGGNCFHIHHYVIMIPGSIIFGVLAYKYRYGQLYLWLLFFCGFLLGGSLTNFMYHDVFKFVKKCSDRGKCVVPFSGTMFGDQLKKLC
jgi:hypothetical protein